MAREANNALVESLVKNAPEDSPPLTVLSDHEVITLLKNMTVEEVINMQQSLRTSLHEYSTAKQDNPACQKNQQERMVRTIVYHVLSSTNLTLRLSSIEMELLP